MGMFTQVQLTFLKVTSVCGIILFEIFADWYKTFTCANKIFTSS